MTSNKIHCIVGPTASGKTAFSLDLAKKIDAEIISVDSRQIYFGMDIGTAKEKSRSNFDPTNYNEVWREGFLIEGIPHYLIDICLPSDAYTAFNFKEQAKYLINQIWERGKNVILVGGTGLYFEVLLYDFQPSDGQSRDPQIKAELEARYEQEGGEQLWGQLVKIDPVGAAKIHPNNPRYLIRALEYFKVTGKPQSAAAKRCPEMIYDVEMTSMDLPRTELYERINKRIDLQMEMGLLKEVETLRAMYDPTLPSMSSLGYKELGQYLDGELELQEALTLFKRNTRRYAKRQLTWFRRYSELF